MNSEYSFFSSYITFLSWNSQIPFQLGLSKTDLRRVLKSSLSGVSKQELFHDSAVFQSFLPSNHINRCAQWGQILFLLKNNYTFFTWFSAEFNFSYVVCTYFFVVFQTYHLLFCIIDNSSMPCIFFPCIQDAMRIHVIATLCRLTSQLAPCIGGYRRHWPLMSCFLRCGTSAR